MFNDIVWRCLILEMFMMRLVSTECPNRHLQREYCNCEVVFMAERPETLSETGSLEMNITAIYKGKGLLDDISEDDMVTVETNVDFTELTEGHVADTYFIVFGSIEDGKVITGECIPFYPYKWMRPYKTWVKSALLHKYKRGCDCVDEIGPSFTDLTCEYISSFMMKKKGTCTWIKTKQYKICEDYFKWIE